MKVMKQMGHSSSDGTNGLLSYENSGGKATMSQKCKRLNINRTKENIRNAEAKPYVISKQLQLGEFCLFEMYTNSDTVIISETMGEISGGNNLPANIITAHITKDMVVFCHKPVSRFALIFLYSSIYIIKTCVLRRSSMYVTI